MKIAVLGANGRVAHTVAKAFLEAGHSVIAVTRTGKCEGLTGNVEFRAADAMKEDDLIAATRGAEIVFNGINPPYDKWDELCMPMAKNALAAIKANNAINLFIGNVYNYGKEIPVNASEDTPFNATTQKAEIRIEMEALFRRAAVEDGVKTIILRAGDFYGTDKPGTWFDLFIAKSLNKGIFYWPGKWDIPHAFAYLPDLGKAFVSLAERSEELPVFSQFNFEGHTLTGEQVARIAEEITGGSLKRKPVPWMVFRIVGAFYPLLREVVKMSYLWFTPHSLDGTKLRTLLGEVEITPPEEAIKQAFVDQGLWNEAPADNKLAA